MTKVMEFVNIIQLISLSDVKSMNASFQNVIINLQLCDGKPGACVGLMYFD